MTNIKILLQKLYLDLKWHYFNPWCVGKMNLAYKHYTESELYGYRVEALGHDFAHKHYHDLQEVKIFVSFFTFKDKLKVLLTPFSCGNEYCMPLHKLLTRKNG